MSVIVNNLGWKHDAKEDTCGFYDKRKSKHFCMADEKEISRNQTQVFCKVFSNIYKCKKKRKWSGFI